MIQFEVVQEVDNQVVLRMNLETFRLFKNMMEQQMQQRQQQDEHSQGFLRRITPFFMNQFFQWSQENDVECVRGLLNALKKNKKSKQKKFELGDLQKIFKNKRIGNYPTTDVKVYWREFLSNLAEKRVRNNKKITQERIQQYLTSIRLLLQELNRKVPYYRLLSRYRENQIVQCHQQRRDIEMNEYDLDFYSHYNQNSIETFDSQGATTNYI